MGRLLWIFCLALCLIGAPGFLQAQGSGPSSAPASQGAPSDTELAKKHFRAAKRLYEVGKFEEAISEYQQAYLYDPQPDVLYNIAQSYRRAGEIGGKPEYLRQAKFHFELFLSKVPDTPYRVDIEALIKDIEKLADKLEKKLLEEERAKERELAKEREKLKTALAQNNGAFGSATDEALKLILGRDYVPFIASGLTLEGYLEVKRGRRNSVLGIYLFTGGVLVGAGGAFLALSERFEGARDIRFLGASGLALGGFSAFVGGILIPYGLYQQSTGKQDIRTISPAPVEGGEIVVVPYFNSDGVGIFTRVGF